MTEKLGMMDQITTAKELLEFWHRNIYNVPRKYDVHILNEMCEMGLLEKINSQKYKFYGDKAKNKLKKLRDNFLSTYKTTDEQTRISQKQKWFEARQKDAPDEP